MWSTADTKAFEFGGSKIVCVCVLQLLPLALRLRVDLPRYHIRPRTKAFLPHFSMASNFPIEIRFQWITYKVVATTDGSTCFSTQAEQNDRRQFVQQNKYRHQLGKPAIACTEPPFTMFGSGFPCSLRCRQRRWKKKETILIKKRRLVFLKRPPKCCFTPFASHSLTTTLSQFTRTMNNGRIYGRNVLHYRNSLS